ncbi:hypothetical protein HNQ71_006683 [Mesorhizobium sangaii]|uniref:Uncharacterized protein n=2 Tax=Mesorhizobium sangaii TaxID=505389 RepID=A0A841PF74_9HYPH|nr:hypothetical protein [Mesorhizobium sangaii]
MGSNERVGMEDNLYLEKGKLARSNAEQVARMREIPTLLTFDIATPAETRRCSVSKGGSMPMVETRQVVERVTVRRAIEVPEAPYTAETSKSHSQFLRRAAPIHPVLRSADGNRVSERSIFPRAQRRTVMRSSPRSESFRSAKATFNPVKIGLCAHIRKI